MTVTQMMFKARIEVKISVAVHAVTCRNGYFRAMWK